MSDYEREDLELKEMMGDRFQDATDAPAKEKIIEVHTDTPHAKKPVQKPNRKPMEANWEPVAELSFTQKLMTCGKKAAVYAFLCLLVFYWQQSGQMDASAAMPCMMACTAMIGVTYGRVFAKEMF